MKTNRIIGFMALAFFAGFCLTSCSTDLNPDNPVKGYIISIPAQKVATKAVDADGKAKFLTDENVYVCQGSTMDGGVLHPKENAASTTLTGTLNGSYSKYTALKVLYNTDASGAVDYSAQDGTIDNVIDAGTATVNVTDVSGNVITTSAANIANLQSIFRFSFICGSTEITNIRFVRIFSSNGTLQAQYNAAKGTGTSGPVTISRANGQASLPTYVYASLRFTKADDTIVFQVIDESGKVYSGSKATPSGGFDNGNFYTASVELTAYTFTVSSGKKVYFSPGDLGVDNGVYSFTEPFTTWGWGSTNKSLAKRVWFNYDEVNHTDISSGQEIYGVKWRIQTKTSGYEWDNVVGRTIDEGRVSPYYRVKIGSNNCCLLLPPDETVASDLDGLTEGATIDSYAKYLGKGFVLLINTGRAQDSNSSGLSWGSSEEGWYWTIYDNGHNRKYLTWSASVNPWVMYYSSSQLRMRVRYVRDVE